MPTPDTLEPVRRRLVSLREAAMAIGLPPKRLQELARKGIVPRIEISSRLHRFDLDDVVAALKAYGQTINT